ncbi:unnamed protein product [Staurois parvus]|uniref:Uncharacterized protein n=1 Tax=Staurois parvus TaxID=386267 RepID=A0ABN9DA84_9NEOB|nr:unnamed protein product [Staurois parvus]
MGTDRWQFWGHTHHQGTLIISALMISRRAMWITGISVFTCDQTQLIT